MLRRERVREATREEIKALARQQMAASGTTALALNAIARALGMVPSALYRYYPDRDALITALIVDAFESLAATLHAADQGVPVTAYGARLLAVACAYRNWALAHPIDFQLIFGNPIPGYQAPPAQTGPAMQRVFAAFLDILQAAHDAGQLRPVANYQPAALETCEPNDPYGSYAPPVMYSGLAGWATMHGVVALELVGQLRFSLSDLDTFFVGQIQTYLTDIGLADITV
jgi:AcrR family transcriptional regulator